MAQISCDEALTRIMTDEVTVSDGIQGLVDRKLGILQPVEGLQLDYKREFSLAKDNSVAEIARDVLAFSNSQGGLVVIGVDDNRAIVGHDPIDARKLRDAIGPYIGTRVVFEVITVSLNVQGASKRVVILHVRRSLAAFPNLLRKDIAIRSSLILKLKYVKGTLFYRAKDVIYSESPLGDLEARGRDLGFTGVSARTTTSFTLAEDKPGLRLYAPINERFFGRETELSELISKFDDPRGRGVSIAGFGGVGKTELGIKLVSELHRRGKFRHIYSGSAKQNLLGPLGVQQTDPVFIDFKSFLLDFAAWLGLNPAVNRR